MREVSHTSSKGVVLVIATMASFFTPFMGSAVNIALPSIGEDFSMNAVLLSWVATSFLLAAAMFLVPFGRLADIYGRKKIFTWGIALYTVSCLLLGLSISAGMLIAFRVLQGIASAMMFGTAVAILTSVFPANERGKALGINVAAVYTGLSIGPPVGGFLTQRLGWQSIFLTNVPLGLIILVVVLWKLRGEWAEARGEKFDLAGSIIYGASLAALMYGFSRLPSISGIWLVVLGVTGILIFVAWETRASSPVLNIRLFQNNKAFSLSSLAALINYSATFAVGFLLSLYLQ
ncbi:MAG: MFS transporter, partial [Chloroflexi bacterium]|nr:MFS transporter [Chloroflexota bacterium]